MKSGLLAALFAVLIATILLVASAAFGDWYNENGWGAFFMIFCAFPITIFIIFIYLVLNIKIIIKKYREDRFLDVFIYGIGFFFLVIFLVVYNLNDGHGSFQGFLGAITGGVIMSLLCSPFKLFLTKKSKRD